MLKFLSLRPQVRQLQQPDRDVPDLRHGSPHRRGHWRLQALRELRLPREQLCRQPRQVGLSEALGGSPFIPRTKHDSYK